MPENDQERRIARLQKEFERLFDEHSEYMARIPPTASPELRESHAKRAEILKRRIRMLKAELNRLRRLSSRQAANQKQPRGSGLAH